MTLFALPFPSIDPVLIEVGPIVVRWYALAYIAGILLGYWYSRRLCEVERLWAGNTPPVQARHIEDFVLWATLGIILGGRIGFVSFYDPAFYIANPSEIFKVWTGGMSFHGGLIGVCLAIFLYTRWQKIPLLSFCDLMGVAAPIGLFFGRIANFINGELYGRFTDVPWAIHFPEPGFPEGGPVARHPSQLYEAALEGLLLFLFLRWMSHSKLAFKRPGLVAGLFGMGYALSRIFVEFFREPDPQLGFLLGGFLTMGMLLSLPVLIIGVLLIINAKRQPPAESA